MPHFVSFEFKAKFMGWVEVVVGFGVELLIKLEELRRITALFYTDVK